MKRQSIRKIAMIALFAAIATIFMTFKFPLAVIAPPFYKLDFSEAIVVLAGFVLGVVPAIAVELIKVLLNFLIDGTVTAGIGEISNFLMGCMFVVPAVAIYRSRKTFISAVVGCAVGAVALSVGASVINYYMLIPAYCAAFGMTEEAIVSMGSVINSSVTDLKSMILFTTLPFNVIKGVLSAVVALIALKPISKAFDRSGIEI